MLKLIGIAVLVLLAVAVYHDPSIVKPWAQAADNASTAIGVGFKKAGEMTASSIIPPGSK